MIIKAHQKSIRTSPRKLRLVAHVVRHLKVADALDRLRAISQQASIPLKKTLRQAQANAVNNHHADPDTLMVKEIQITPGPTYKRWQPVSRGRAHSIFKRTSHIRILVESPDRVTIKPSSAKKGPHGTKS